MSEDSGDKLWSTALKHRTQLYRSQAHSRPNREVLRDKISKTLSILDNLAIELKSCMNTVSVAHLPPEILVSIFHFLSYDLPIIPAAVEKLVYDDNQNLEGQKDVESSSGPGDSGDSKRVEDMKVSSTWLKIMHVCSYWRQIALSDSSLWTQVSSKHSLTWTDVFLARSRPNSKLTVHLGADMIPGSSHDCSLWKDAISRARTLYITEGFQYWQGCLSSRNTSPKSLVKLSVNLAAPGEGADEYEHACPSDIFGEDEDEHINELRELSLCGFLNYSWPPPLLSPTLTSLKLGIASQVWAELEASLQEILDTLLQLQSLQSLALLGLIIVHPLQHFENHRDTLHLPRLQLLHIEECEPGTLSAILNAVVVSADGAKICLVPSGPFREDKYALLDAIKHRLSAHPWNDLQAVALLPADSSPSFMELGDSRDTTCIILSAWRNEADALVSVQEKGETPRPDLYLRLPWIRDDLDTKDHPRKTLQLVKHISARTLCLLVNEHTSYQAFSWDVLQGFSGFQHVVLRGSVSTRAMKCMYRDSPYTDNQEALVSSLRRLTFLNDADDPIDWNITLIVSASDHSVITAAQLLERVYWAHTDSGLAMEIFVDGNDLANGAFNAMSDQSMLQVASRQGHSA